MPLNNRSTETDKKGSRRPVDRLQVTPEYAETLHQRDKAGEELTPTEKRICNVAYAAEMAEQVIDLVAYGGFDIALGKQPAWKIGCRLVDAPTIGQQAVGYQYLLSVLIETDGILQEIITKLWSDLGRLPLGLEEIDDLTTRIADEVRHG